MVVIVALVSVGGAMRGEIAAQAERPFVFYRICNIEPGQDAAAVALAGKMVDLASRKYPSAQMAARKGRWMTGFQEIAQPVNQILFCGTALQPGSRPGLHRCASGRRRLSSSATENQGGVIDVSSCVDPQFRASP